MRNELNRSRMLKGIIFDLDGTLIDSHYDWKLIRKKIGVNDLPILTYIDGLKGSRKKDALKILEVFESTATRKARLQKGIKELLAFITKRGIKKAIVTNNSRKNVEYLIKKWQLFFDEIVTRNDGVWKPSGKPLELAIEKFNLRKEEIIFVGNSNPDRIAAQRAGIKFICVDENKGMDEIYTLLKNNSEKVQSY